MSTDERQVVEGLGVGDGVRTRGHRNHNPALYQLSYTHRRHLKFTTPDHGRPANFQSSSTRRRTSGDMRMTSGQGRVKPSSGHLRVASMPIFEP
jgi:hypothetical protein